MIEMWRWRRDVPACAFLFIVVLMNGTGAHAAPCEPVGTVRVTVDLAPTSDKTIAGVKVDLDYPEDRLKIPGFGDAPEVKLRVSGFPEGFLGAPNDLDDDLIVALAGTTGLPRGAIFTIEFDRCKGGPMPTPKDFRCKVEQASTDTGVLVEGTTCSVRVLEGSDTKTTTKSK